MIEKQQLLTRNIAKSGEVRNWGVFSPFQLHLGLIANHSQSASCHNIAKRYLPFWNYTTNDCTKILE